MNNLKFDYQQSAQLAEVEYIKAAEHLIPEVQRINSALHLQYQTPYASINLLDDDYMHKEIHGVVEQKKELHIHAIVIIGIGGSNLGTKAIYEAIEGCVQISDKKMDVYWADTVDPNYIQSLLDAVEHHLKQNEKVLLFIVSKSGTTTETIANAELFIALLKKYETHQYNKYIVISTQADSSLWKLGQNQQISCLSIPQLVGGRFSVFSSVGLFPLGLLDIDTHQLLDGARIMRHACCNKIINQNPAAMSAIVLYVLSQKGFTIHDTFLFAVCLESLGKWYRQLLAESIGKRFSRDGTEIDVGITPTVSIGSTDLHSVGQLYLGGPYDKITTFVRMNQWTSSLIMPTMPEYEKLVADIQGRPFEDILNAIVDGVQKVYSKDHRPFMTITFPEKNAYYMGQFMQMKMMEIMYLGYLFNINPFDQPEVERYKINTKAILSHE